MSSEFYIFLCLGFWGWVHGPFNRKKLKFRQKYKMIDVILFFKRLNTGGEINGKKKQDHSSNIDIIDNSIDFATSQIYILASDQKIYVFVLP